MANGVLYGKCISPLKELYGERIAFLAADYYNPHSDRVIVLFTPGGYSDYLSRDLIKLESTTKITNLNRDKGAFYDRRTSKPSNRLP